ncbi:MAG: glycogen synthase [Dehalococcoidia bacterium]|nr:glycogen synthase [Dehalococcoidia bacterium]
MKILFAAAEIAPLTKVGGLADVVRSLPSELIKMGHQVRVIVPRYGFVDYSSYKSETVINELIVFSLKEYRRIKLEQIVLDGVPVYLLSTDIIDRSDSVYGGDEVEKFWVFCDCVSQSLPYLDWKPDIVHCHDWHTALLPLLLRAGRFDCRTVFTIHNLKYQGNFDSRILHRSGIDQYWLAQVPGLTDLPWNLIVQGILCSHVINTVSENFAREILTAEYGCGMQAFIKFRKSSLFGIVNGVGYDEYDPGSDPLIEANYSSENTTGKAVNKLKLLTTAGWKPRPAAPLVGMVSRLDEQKGMDIIINAVPEVIKSTGARFIFLGRGKEYYEESLLQLESKYPDNVRAYITYDNAMAHLVYAGSDLFLMPSLWEPCGLGQMIAMRYGTLPVVRNTGGLADTVLNLSGDLKQGTGFVFSEYSAKALVFTFKKAAEAFSNKTAWQRIIKRVMEFDFSWQASAQRYQALYKRALELKTDGPL